MGVPEEHEDVGGGNPAGATMVLEGHLVDRTSPTTVSVGAWLCRYLESIQNIMLWHESFVELRQSVPHNLNFLSFDFDEAPYLARAG